MVSEGGAQESSGRGVVLAAGDEALDEVWEDMSDDFWGIKRIHCLVLLTMRTDPLVRASYFSFIKPYCIVKGCGALPFLIIPFTIFRTPSGGLDHHVMI